MQMFKSGTQGVGDVLMGGHMGRVFWDEQHPFLGEEKPCACPIAVAWSVSPAWR